MSSSTEKEAANVTTCAARDKESNCSVDNIAAKRLTLQIEDLSIENDDEEGDNNITTCAACGKESDKESMNICNKCKMVHYCNVTCKKKHKSKHKKKCDRRVAELYDEDLFKEPPPPGDCPYAFSLCHTILVKNQYSNRAVANSYAMVVFMQWLKNQLGKAKKETNLAFVPSVGRHHSAQMKRISTK